MKDLVPTVDGLIDINSRNNWSSINRKSDIILRKTLLLGRFAIRAASWPMRSIHLLNVECLLKDSEGELLWTVTWLGGSFRQHVGSVDLGKI